MSSNRDETAEIILGGETFQLKAPTFDELQELAEQLDALSAGGSFKAKLPALRKVIEQLSGRSVPGSLQTTFLEIHEAIEAAMKVTGLEALGELMRRRQQARASGAKG